MAGSLTDRQIKYATRQHKKGRKTSEMPEIKVTPKNIQRLPAKYGRTGKPPTIRLPDKPPTQITKHSNPIEKM